MGNYTIFWCSKILGKQEILQKMIRNSRSQIVFWTHNFPKIIVGCPWYFCGFFSRTCTTIPPVDKYFLCRLVRNCCFGYFEIKTEVFKVDVGPTLRSVKLMKFKHEVQVLECELSTYQTTFLSSNNLILAFFGQIITALKHNRRHSEKGTGRLHAFFLVE